jgi:hypothetical protein
MFNEVAAATDGPLGSRREAKTRLHLTGAHVAQRLLQTRLGNSDVGKLQ